MSDPEMPLAEAKATVRHALELRTLNLIGVTTGRAGTTALLRSSDGQIARVSAGDAAFGVTVTAIGENMVVTSDRWGRTQSLMLPTG